MIRKEFSQALKIAQDPTIDLSNEDFNMTAGCELRGFKPVYVTLRAVARLIRYQAQYIGGGWDGEEIDTLARLSKKLFLIV